MVEPLNLAWSLMALYFFDSFVEVFLAPVSLALVTLLVVHEFLALIPIELVALAAKGAIVPDALVIFKDKKLVSAAWY